MARTNRVGYTNCYFEFQVAVNHNTSKSWFKKWTFRGLIAAIVLALVFGFTQFTNVPIKMARETTLYVEPLNSLGDVDFLTAFERDCYSVKLATPENGFRLILENVDFSKTINGLLLKNACEKLALDSASIRPTLTYEDPVDFATKYFHADDFDEKFIRRIDLRSGLSEEDLSRPYKDWEAGDVIISRSNIPWTTADLPMMSEWVQANSPVLDLYAQAVRLPCFESPFCRSNDLELMIEMASPFMITFRGVARGYQTRANYYLGTGEVRKAMDDIISCKRLGRHIRNLSSIVDRLVGVAIENIANSIGVTNVANDVTSKADLEYLVSELRLMPKLAGLEKSALYEKLTHLEILQRIARTRGGKQAIALDDFEKLGYIGLDWNVVLQEFGNKFDRYWAGEYSLEEESTSFAVSDLLFRSVRSRKFAIWYLQTMAPAHYAMIEAERRTQCGDNLRLLTLAMLLFEKDHGSLPPAYVVDSNQNFLHSWRVLLLPYLGEEDLYKSLKLDQPWNSKHNARFADSCPRVFSCPSCSECNQGHTSYTVVVGTKLPFSGGTGSALASFGRNSDDMVLIAERSFPVNWMDPTQETELVDAEKGINFDMTAERNDERLSIGSQHPAIAQFGFRNGAVSYLSDYLDKRIFSDQLRGTNKRYVEY